MAKARRRRIWSGSRDCLANVRRAAASKSGRRGTGAAMALLEQNWPPRNHTHAPRTTPAHESHFRGVGITRHVFASKLRAFSRKSASNQLHQHSVFCNFVNIILINMVRVATDSADQHL